MWMVVSKKSGTIVYYSKSLVEASIEHYANIYNLEFNNKSDDNHDCYILMDIITHFIFYS